MTVLRMTIRRPPRCRACNGTGFDPAIRTMLGNSVVCSACKGRSAHVEYFVEYGPLTATKAVWANEESGPYARERI